MTDLSKACLHQTFSEDRAVAIHLKLLFNPVPTVPSLRILG